MVRGESGAQGKERGFVLIIHPYPLTDRSQHAALWASAPAYRAQKKGGLRETVVRWWEAEREEEINACQASSLGEVLVVHCSKHCLISLFVCTCTCVMSVLCFQAGSGGLSSNFAGLIFNFFWFHSLHQSPFNKICCLKHLYRITEYLKKLNSANSCIFFLAFSIIPPTFCRNAPGIGCLATAGRWQWAGLSKSQSGGDYEGLVVVAAQRCNNLDISFSAQWAASP